MRTLVSAEKLKTLFEAHREGNNSVFQRVASSIISDELASNHHHHATELQQALGRNEDSRSNGTPRTPQMRSLPKDRRHGEDLLWMRPVDIAPDRVILGRSTQSRIARVLEEHRQRKRLQAAGYRPKTKLLFWGPPGTGKTLTASLLAHELGLPLGVLKLNTAISSFLGDTASHLQRVFSRASETSMVLLLDEADAVAKNRDDPNDVGELKRVVNGLLQAMDAFTHTDSLIIAASNHQYLLDPALWRRFEDVVHFPLPAEPERKRFLQLLLNGVSFKGSLSEAAKQTADLSYADIERATIEAVKTMILEERSTLSGKDISLEIRSWKSAIKGAQTRTRHPR